MSVESLARELAESVPEVLGAPGDIAAWPGGYPDSLALCVIDSIQSLGVRYTSVEKVVGRYRTRYPTADSHDVDELVNSFDDSTGPKGWAEAIGTRHRTSTAPGAPLKAEAIQQAAQLLHDADVPNTRTLRSLNTEALDPVKTAWLSLPGQRSGISWRYLLMLAGVPGAKPDRMIHRFLNDHTSADSGLLSNSEAAAVVAQAADLLGMDTRTLDHAMWNHARRRNSGR